MSSLVSHNRLTFRKSERLCSRKILEQLTTKGKSVHVFPIRLVWMVTTLPEKVPAQVAFSVPKRNFKKATDRNSVKRRMREAYRKNKTLFYPLLINSKTSLAMLLIFTGKSIITYKESENKLKNTLLQLAEVLQKSID